jgi:hypothetical protein
MAALSAPPLDFPAAGLAQLGRCAGRLLVPFQAAMLSCSTEPSMRQRQQATAWSWRYRDPKGDSPTKFRSATKRS